MFRLRKGGHNDTIVDRGGVPILSLKVWLSWMGGVNEEMS